jgi:two-component system, OmpR family, response regulator
MSERKTTILYVEDDASLQKLVRIALESLGRYTVRTAGDGHEAMAIARDPAPELLLLDMNLPGMNGIATLRALRQLPGLAEVPVIFLTAVNDPAVEVELYALGARGVLRKPFRPRLLLQSIDGVLGRESA